MLSASSRLVPWYQVPTVLTLTLLRGEAIQPSLPPPDANNGLTGREHRANADDPDDVSLSYETFQADPADDDSQDHRAE
jgi:hypothetical protein